MLVVDTSAAIEALVADSPDRELVDRLTADDDLHVPHLIDVEFQHALRRLVMRGKLSIDRAGDARTDFADLRMIRYPHDHLADRIWALRDTVTPYDAAFVALAEVLGAVLVTCDAKLTRASHDATTELYGTA